MTEISDLIARLEKATGPDRQLDCAIFKAAELEALMVKHQVESWFCSIDYSSYGFNTGREPACIWCGLLPNYTASIDAALTLVPEGWPIEKLAWWPSVPAGYESKRACTVNIMGLDHSGFGNPRKQFSAKAPTIPLALCIAALKARQTNGADR